MANQPQPQISTFQGSYSSYQPFRPGSQVSGSFSGQITTWPTAADYAASQERTAAQIQAMGSQLQASLEAMTSTLMRTNTLDPDTYYGGIVHFARFKGSKILLEIQFGGEVFNVYFTIP